MTLAKPNLQLFSEKRDSLGPKLSVRSFMGLFGGGGGGDWGQVEQQPRIMTRHASCCVFCAQITSGTSRSMRTYFCKSCIFFPVDLFQLHRKKPSLKLLHSVLIFCYFSQGKIAPGISSSFSFTFSFCFSYNSTFRLAVSSCFNPTETFHLAKSTMHVYIHILPNNPIKCICAQVGSQAITLFRSELFVRSTLLYSTYNLN